MLLTSAVVSGKGSLSSTDAFVGGSSGGSRQGVQPGASNGECLVCHEHQVVLAMEKRPGENRMEQLFDGYLVLNVTSEQCPGSRANVVLAALIAFPLGFLPEQFILSEAFLLNPPPSRASQGKRTHS